MRAENHGRKKQKKPTGLDIEILLLREQGYTYVAIGKKLGITKNKVAGILFRVNKHFPGLRASDLKAKSEAPVVAPVVISATRPPKWEKEGLALREMILANQRLAGPFERFRPGTGLGWAVN